MPQWEYRKIDLCDISPKKDDIDLLNEAGREEWELVAIIGNNCAYLKRPIRTAAASARPRGRQSAPKTET